MAPSEAKALTPDEALFYLSDEDAVKRVCSLQNKTDPIIAEKLNPQRNAEQHREYMRELRKKFTGSEEF